MRHSTGTRALGIAAAAGLLALAGCGSDGGSAKNGGPTAGEVRTLDPADPGPSKNAALSVEDAYRAYQQATMGGCTDADDCQALMTRKMAALADLRRAMQAEDPGRYAVPIGYIEQAEHRADHYGRNNLAAKGNMAAVNQPAQQAIDWLAQHAM